MAQLSQKVLINGDEYELKGNVDFSNLTIKLIGVDTPDPEVPPVPGTDPTKPTEGTVKEGGWGANLDDKNAWKVVNMKDFPEQFKIVDAAGKNVATNFKTKEVAENFIAYFKTHPFPPEDTTQPPNPPVDPTPGANGDGPYPQKVGSKTLQSTQRGPTTRHYASGKPDDETIEKNVKDISYRNYQWIVETTIKEMEHDDTISLKFGGQHTSGNGWWDTGVGIYDGQTCLGTEPDHPETHLCLVKGPKIGDIRNKKIKIAGVFFEQNDHIELWTNLEGKGWVKQVEGDHVGNLKPDHSKGHETQERIDGFAKGSVPELHFAVVQEIDPKGSVPTPPPVEPPITPPVTPPIEPPVEPPITPPVTPPPQPAGSGVTRDGVKIPYETTGKFEYVFRHNDRDDGKRMDFNNLKAGEYVNAVVLGYFAFPQDNAPDDEVSGKFSAMPHSGSNRTECFDMGTGIKDGATRIRYEAKHPDYTGDLGNGEKGLPLKTKYIGYMYARKNLPNGNVLCEQWQDQGDNEGSTPANKWKKLFSWEDPKYTFKDYKDGHGVTIRVDGNNVVKDMKLKWLALVEIK